MQQRDDVFVDEEIAQLLVELIDGAKEYLTLVTPWVKLWRHSDLALSRALQRGVKITILVRSGDDGARGEEIESLVQRGVKVLSADGLHAKIYLSEATTIISSMNLLDYSMRNALDIAFVVKDRTNADGVRRYVFERLIETSRPWGTQRTSKATAVAPIGSHTHAGTRGVCIRCGRNVGFDPVRPICELCYQSWAQWKNIDYPERHCHACGASANVTYAKPLCLPCFKALA